jgi:predicted RNase H-like HicB family nuclease
MAQPDDTLQVIVEYHDGQAEGDDGHPYYVATCAQIGAVTDGRTLDEVLKNLREVIELALEDEDTVETYNIVPNPRVSIVMELPAYAQIA